MQNLISKSRQRNARAIYHSFCKESLLCGAVVKSLIGVFWVNVF